MIILTYVEGRGAGGGAEGRLAGEDEEGHDGKVGRVEGKQAASTISTFNASLHLLVG